MRATAKLLIILMLTVTMQCVLAALEGPLDEAQFVWRNYVNELSGKAPGPELLDAAKRLQDRNCARFGVVVAAKPTTRPVLPAPDVDYRWRPCRAGTTLRAGE
jgi:hypothetical protein